MKNWRLLPIVVLAQLGCYNLDLHEHDGGLDVGTADWPIEVAGGADAVAEVGNADGQPNPNGTDGGGDVADAPLGSDGKIEGADALVDRVSDGAPVLPQVDSATTDGRRGTGGNGSMGTGGAAGNSGASGTGGMPSVDGTGGAGGAGSGGATGSGGCSFTRSAKTAPNIGTVGIVTWSTDLALLKSAKIDFGLDTDYGMTAPVAQPVAGDNTTLLLGMKPARGYHYRITVTGSDDRDCVSPDYTLRSGALVSSLPKVSVTTKSSASPAYGGFLITGQYVQMSSGDNKAPAYIVDRDGEIVWAMAVTTNVTGARMSYDGRYMWINNANVPNDGAQVHRVSMDGETDEDLSGKFTGLNHQLTVLPDETVAFYAYGENNCDDIKEYAPATGTVRTVVNAGTAEGGVASCHVNNIQYSRDDDTLLFSDLDNQTVVKVRRSDGSTVWVANGAQATLAGDTWRGSQHGIHVIAQDRFVLFNGNSRVVAGGMGSVAGTGDGSLGIEFRVDTNAMTITKLWSFKSSIQNDVMGDIQRMDNGNTIMGFSTKGQLLEIDMNGTVVQEWTWPLGTSFGYIERRATLYGPPLR